MSSTPGTALVLIRIVPHADEGLVLRHYVSSITHCHPAHCAHESSLIGLRSAAYQVFALSINNASNTHISDMVCCRFFIVARSKRPSPTAVVQLITRGLFDEVILCLVRVMTQHLF